MPIYAYRCEHCAHEMEALQKISADPLRECPICHQETLKKQVTAAAFRLKGSGWYESDFKNNNSKNSVSKDSKNEQTAPSQAHSCGANCAHKH